MNSTNNGPGQSGISQTDESRGPTALQQGRYRWRHDKVLAVLADIQERGRKQKQPRTNKGPSSIKCVKAGEKTATSHPNLSGLLRQATSWEMRVDLVFPDVVHTYLRLDEMGVVRPICRL